ncbi:MAG: MFS transporter [Nevskiaceae bacterium]|nr:MAG: MFS transporter [Nevskiaceae bacterium]TBR72217.1 MAG: MFS transporter [Nevskiaceae bacterium]
MTSRTAQPAAVPPGWTLVCLCSAAFLVFVQTFMVAPLIPRLSQALLTTTDWVGLAVPAYIVPEALATLAVGPLSDRIGRRGVIIGCLCAFIILTAATATATGIQAFIGWRIATGIAAAGIVPIGLTLIGDLFPFNQRGRAVGWLFGAIAGGTAAGAAVGALLEPVVGWRGLFLAVAALSALLLVAMLTAHALPRSALPAQPSRWREVLRGYGRLLSHARGQRTYAYVFLNAVLQSGVFTWLGVYLHQRFGLTETGIGLTLLGYGIPGLLFGPIIGRFADRHGRAFIIPAGVALTGLCALALAAPLELVAVQVAVILLSLGFDLTHPQLAAITTDLGGGRGQSVALMAFSLFSGFGIGSLVFQAALAYGFGAALVSFGVAALLAATLAAHLFRSERRRPPAAVH